MANIANSKLFKNIEGIPVIKDALVILVKTEWNAEIVDELENGCIKVFHQYKIKTKTVVVPGAVEIPFAVNQCWQKWKKKKKPAAFITLGAVVRGGTPHFDYVCNAVTNGVAQLNIQLPVPVIFGVLTVDNMVQATERIGGAHGHKGEEAAISAIKMILLNQQLDKL